MGMDQIKLFFPLFYLWRSCIHRNTYFIYEPYSSLHLKALRLVCEALVRVPSSGKKEEGASWLCFAKGHLCLNTCRSWGLRSIPAPSLGHFPYKAGPQGRDRVENTVKVIVIYWKKSTWFLDFVFLPLSKVGGLPRGLQRVFFFHCFSIRFDSCWLWL